jgi:hypothetical protein
MLYNLIILNHLLLHKGLKSTITKKIEDVGQIGLKEGSIDVFLKKVWQVHLKEEFGTQLNLNWLMYSLKEYERGGQFAAERGTYDYYTRKYKIQLLENKRNIIHLMK